MKRHQTTVITTGQHAAD